MSVRPPTWDDFDEIRREAVTATWRLFHEYGCTQAPQFVVGALALGGVGELPDEFFDRAAGGSV